MFLTLEVNVTWLGEGLVTPHTVVTTEREPAGWLGPCCQGTESYGYEASLWAEKTQTPGVIKELLSASTRHLIFTSHWSASHDQKQDSHSITLTSSATKSAYGVKCEWTRADLCVTTDVSQPHALEVLGAMLPWRLHSHLETGKSNDAKWGGWVSVCVCMCTYCFLCNWIKPDRSQSLSPSFHN